MNLHLPAFPITNLIAVFIEIIYFLYTQEHKGYMMSNSKITTTDAGIPVASDEHSLSVGPDG
ncbi:hypothetical protein, partial [Pantoea stewartii]